MIVLGNVFIYLLLLTLSDQSLTSMPDDLILELYSKYISAVSKANFTISTRRLLKKYREFEIHVTKLKEVNGYKKHNLFVKENIRYGAKEPYIYINNPVESKIPKAYLTLAEFKNALINRVKAQKKEFSSKRTKKVTYAYMDILRQRTYETRAQTLFRNSKEIVNITEKVNLKTNTDAKKYNININEINYNKDLNKDTTTISAETISENNDVQTNFTITEKDSKNNIPLYLATNVTEDFKHDGTEKGLKKVNSQDILDTTKVITKNTYMEETTSPSQTIDLVNELVTDTTTVVDNTLHFRTNNSETNTNIEDMANVSSTIKEEPRRKKTTKYSSVSTKLRRSTLGRPLVFFGSR